MFGGPLYEIFFGSSLNRYSKLLQLTFLAFPCILKRTGSQLILNDSFDPSEDTALDIEAFGT